jgi:hypothetical protein
VCRAAAERNVGSRWQEASDSDEADIVAGISNIKINNDENQIQEHVKDLRDKGKLSLIRKKKLSKE